MSLRVRPFALAALAAAGAAAWFAAASAAGPSADRASRDANAPYGRALLAVPRALSRLWGAVAGGAAAARERDELRAERDGLRAAALEAQRLREENEGLRRALNLPVRLGRMVCAEVLSSGGTTGWRCVLRIGRGARDGVAPGQAVVSAHGLVGRVESVSARTADVLLLSDANSRVSCLVETVPDPEREGRAPASRPPPARGILRGGGIARSDRELEMLRIAVPFTVDYLGKDAEIRPGARVVTSGLGGGFPGGLLVGRVVEAGLDDTRLCQRATVAPASDLGALRRVFVLVGTEPPAAASDGGDGGAP